MLVVVRSQFTKQLDKFKSVELKEKVLEVIAKVEKAKTLTEIKDLKKLKGYKTAFRIKIGNYRIGVVFKDNTLNFTAIGLRKDFYTIFP